MRLTADRDAATTDWDDVVHLTVEVVDADGVRCPWADPVVEFEIDGPGEIVAVDNGDPESHESFQEPRRRMFRGRGLVIVRRTADEGAVTVTATSSGLEPAAATINAARRRAPDCAARRAASELSTVLAATGRTLDTPQQ